MAQQPQRRITPERVHTVRAGVRQLKDPMVKTSEKILIIIGIAYALSPIDLLPDVLPPITWADDVVVTGGTITVAVLGVVFRALARKVQRTTERH